jgi:hypothetical protein
MKTYKLVYKDRIFYVRDADRTVPLIELSIGQRNYLYHKAGLEAGQETLPYLEENLKNIFLAEFDLIEQFLSEHPIRDNDVYIDSVTEITPDILKERRFILDKKSDAYINGDIKVQFEANGTGVHFVDSLKTFFFYEDLIIYCRQHNIHTEVLKPKS